MGLEDAFGGCLSPQQIIWLREWEEKTLWNILKMPNVFFTMDDKPLHEQEGAREFHYVEFPEGATNEEIAAIVEAERERIRGTEKLS